MAQQPSFPGYAGLRSRVDEVRLKAARDLQRYVSTELRELPAERYSSSLDDINQTIYSLISSQEVHEKKGGILAIGECSKPIERVGKSEGEGVGIKAGNYFQYLSQIYTVKPQIKVTLLTRDRLHVDAILA